MRCIALSAAAAAKGAKRVAGATAVLAALVSMLLLGMLATSPPAQAGGAAAQKYPKVVKVKVRARGGDRFDFDVTVSSPYDTPRRYADAFKVSATDGKVFGERRLLHDHADEQPFTRDLHGVLVPPGVRVVVVQARDREFGYGGASVEVSLPERH